jgi:hypothetical protein
VTKKKKFYGIFEPNVSDVLAVLFFAENHFDEKLETLFDRDFDVDGVVKFLGRFFRLRFLEMVLISLRG